MLKWWLSSYDLGRKLDGRYDLIFEVATMNVNLEMLQWLKDEGKLPKGHPLAKGVRCFSAEAIYWLYANASTVPLRVQVDNTGAYDDLELIQRLHEREKVASTHE